MSYHTVTKNSRNKMRQDEYFTPKQSFHRNKGFSPPFVFGIMRENFASLIDSHDHPVFVQYQDIIKKIAKKIKDNLMNPVVAQLLKNCIKNIKTINIIKIHKPLKSKNILRDTRFLRRSTFSKAITFSTK